MRGYTKVTSPADAHWLENAADGFVDAVVREVSTSSGPAVPRTHPRRAISSLTLRTIIELANTDRPLELVALPVISLAISPDTWFEEDGGPLTYESARLTGLPIISLRLHGLRFSAGSLYHRFREPPQVPRMYLGDVPPAPDAVHTISLGDGWLQCSACMDGFRPARPADWHICPTCLRVLEQADGTG